MRRKAHPCVHTPSCCWRSRPPRIGFSTIPPAMTILELFPAILCAGFRGLSARVSACQKPALTASRSPGTCGPGPYPRVPPGLGRTAFGDQRFPQSHAGVVAVPPVQLDRPTRTRDIASRDAP